MIIKQILEILKKEDPERQLKLGWSYPHSYRGYYDRLAVEPTKNVYIEDMIRDLENSIGRTFAGYKGGEFTMYEDTEVYLAECGYTGIKLTHRRLLDMLGKSDIELLKKFTRELISRTTLLSHHPLNMIFSLIEENKDFLKKIGVVE